MYFFIKVLISAIIIALASELAKHHRVLAAVLLSIPLTSLLAFVWIYIDSGDKEKLVYMSYDIVWLVLISLIFFVAFPLLLKQGVNFWISLIGSTLITAVGYALTLWIRHSLH